MSAQLAPSGRSWTKLRDSGQSVMYNLVIISVRCRLTEIPNHPSRPKLLACALISRIQVSHKNIIADSEYTKLWAKQGSAGYVRVFPQRNIRSEHVLAVWPGLCGSNVGQSMNCGSEIPDIMICVDFESTITIFVRATHNLPVTCRIRVCLLFF